MHLTCKVYAKLYLYSYVAMQVCLHIHKANYSVNTGQFSPSILYACSG